jgi:hypothetical protein
MTNIYDIREYLENLQEAKARLDNVAENQLNGYQMFNEVFSGVLYRMSEQVKEAGIKRRHPDLILKDGLRIEDL